MYPWLLNPNRIFSLTCGCNDVMDKYIKCSCVESAHHLFNQMSKRDLVSWNTIISGYVQRRDLNEFLALFHILSPASMMLNIVTLVSILLVCGDLKALVEDKSIHYYIIKKGFDVRCMYDDNTCSYVCKMWGYRDRLPII